MPATPFTPGARPAPARRRWPTRLALAVLLGLYAPAAWLALLNFGRNGLGPELDPSWVAVISRAMADRSRFGVETLFTYGPLVGLAVGTPFDGRTFGAFFAAELGLKAAFVVLVCRLAGRVLPGWRAWLLPVAAIGAGVADWQALFFFGAVAAGVVVSGRERVDRWLTLPALLLLAALALVKGTLLVLATLAAGAGALACARWLGWRAAAWRLLAFFGLLAGLWAALGQRVGDLPSFVRGTLDIAGGYSRGMSQPPADPAVLWLGLVTLAAAGGQILFLLWRDRRDPAAWPLALLLGGALFLGWKQGYTRADAHVGAFFGYAVLGAAAAPLCFPTARGRTAAWAHVGGTALVFALAWAGTTRAGLDTGAFIRKVIAIRRRLNPEILVNPRAAAVDAKNSVLRDRRAYDLPRIRKTVGRGTVDLLGFEQGVAIANRLNLTPAPVCQAYQANTPYTQTLNQEFYRGPRAPEWVIYKLQPVDGHFPTAENAGVFATLALDYAPVLAEDTYLLFQRRTPPPPAGGAPRPLPVRRVLAEGELALDEPLPVPTGLAPDELVWCELDLAESLPGKLLATAYQQQPVQGEVSLADGRGERRYRLIPGMLKTGFLLSPLVDSASALVALQAGGEGLARVRSLRLVHENDPWLARQFRPRWRYRLLALDRPAEDPVRAAAVDALARRTLEAHNDVADPEPTSVRSEVAAGSRFRCEGEIFLFIHPPGAMEFALPAGATHARGHFAYNPTAWRDGERPSPTEFRVDYLPPDGNRGEQTLFRRVLSPATEPADRLPAGFEVALPAGGGRLLLRTLPEPGTGQAARAWVGWGGVEIK